MIQKGEKGADWQTIHSRGENALLLFSLVVTVNQVAKYVNERNGLNQSKNPKQANKLSKTMTNVR